METQVKATQQTSMETVWWWFSVDLRFWDCEFSVSVDKWWHWTEQRYASFIHKRRCRWPKTTLYASSFFRQGLGPRVQQKNYQRVSMLRLHRLRSKLELNRYSALLNQLSYNFTDPLKEFERAIVEQFWRPRYLLFWNNVIMFLTKMGPFIRIITTT